MTPSFQNTANLFNVGGATGISSGAMNYASPMINSSNNMQNALQQLAMSRASTQQGMQQAGLGLQNQATQNYLQSLQPNLLNWAGLGVSGYGALMGRQTNQNVQNGGSTPNPNLPVPQPNESFETSGIY